MSIVGDYILSLSCYNLSYRGRPIPIGSVNARASPFLCSATVCHSSSNLVGRGAASIGYLKRRVQHDAPCRSVLIGLREFSYLASMNSKQNRHRLSI